MGNIAGPEKEKFNLRMLSKIFIKGKTEEADFGNKEEICDLLTSTSTNVKLG